MPKAPKAAAQAAAKNTDSSPAKIETDTTSADPALRKMAETQSLVAAMPFNASKAGEHGFAIKFFTDEGNWDLVGNNMPVFFIQDAIKFPDLVHAVKPEPHNGMPQAGSADDTFWDFASLMPESTHMLMWAMSDRAIPRSYATMQGFGVHGFRLVNDAGALDFIRDQYRHGKTILVLQAAFSWPGHVN